MEQKRWEERLDRVADRVSDAVNEGVHALEDAFDKNRDSRRTETGSPSPEGQAAGAPGVASKKSSRAGLVLVALGIVWLLHSLGILDHPVFPILLVIAGVYLIARAK